MQKQLKSSLQSRLQGLVLEPRVVFDGAMAETAHDALAPAQEAVAPVTIAAPVMAGSAEKIICVMPGLRSHTSQAVVFIDARISDPGILAASSPAGATIVQLDGSEDGLSQIAAYLAGKNDVASVHIVSHGHAGALQLGNGQVTAASIDGHHAADLAAIKTALTANADILLYGCSVAEGDEGATFVAALARATGADVAASVDDTGSAVYGGDWDLEKHEGSIEAKALFAPEWNGILAPLTISTTAQPTVSGTGNVGTMAIWANAGFVGSTAIDLRATVTTFTPGFAGATTPFFGTAADNPYIQLTQQSIVTLKWELFAAGTNQTVTAVGAPSWTIKDIDGIGGVVNTRESAAPSLYNLQSYTAEAVSNIVISGSGTTLQASGTQDQASQPNSAVVFRWSDVQSFEVTYRLWINDPLIQARFEHDGDGDFAFVTPKTTNLLTVDLDKDDSTQSGTGYLGTFQENGPAVAIVDLDINIEQHVALGTNLHQATVRLTNAQAGDQLFVDGSSASSGTVTVGATTFDYMITVSSGEIVVEILGTAAPADYEAVLKLVTFECPGDAPSTVDRQIEVSVKNTVLGTSSAAVLSTIKVKPENGAPLLDLNSAATAADAVRGNAITFTEGDAPIELSAAEGEAIDLDGTDITSILISVANFQLDGTEILNVGGVAFAFDGALGSGTFSTTIDGTSFSLVFDAAAGTITVKNPASVGTPMDPVDLNALLKTITFVQTSENPNGALARTVTFTATDAGGLASEPAIAAITVVPVNDAPIATNNVGSGTAHQPISVAVLGNDVDPDGTLVPASVRLVGTANAGDSLVVAGQGTWSVNTTTGAITFTALSTFDGGPTPVSYTVADNSGVRSNAASVTVLPLASDPHLDLSGATPRTGAYLYGHNNTGFTASWASPAGLARFSGVDPATGGPGLTYTNDNSSGYVTGVASVTLDQAIAQNEFISMKFATLSSIPETWITETGKRIAGGNFKFAFAISSDDFASATLLSKDNAPSSGPVYDANSSYVTAVATDFQLQASTNYEVRVYFYDVSGGTMTTFTWDDIYTSYSNDPTSHQTTFTEGGSAVAITGTSPQIEDVDTASMVSGLVTLTNKYAGDQLLISGAAVANGSTGTVNGIGYAVSETAGQIAISLTGSASKTAYAAALSAITFNNSSDNPETTNRLVQVTINDGLRNSNIAITTIGVVPVNDAPILDLNSIATLADGARGNAVTFTEGSMPVAVTSNVADVNDFTEADITALTIVVGSNPDGAYEHVSIGGQRFDLAVDATRFVAVGGSDSVTITYVAATGTFTVTEAGGGVLADAALDALVRSVTYQNTDESPTAGNRTLTFTVSDVGGVTSGSAIATIAVVPTSDAPVIDLNGGASLKNLVVNGDFETGFTFPSDSNNPFAGWTNNNPSSYAEIGPWSPGTSGPNVLDMESGLPGNMDFQQAISGLTPGRVVAISLDSVNYNAPFTGNGLDVYFGGVLVGRAASTIDWVTTTFAVTEGMGDGSNVLRLVGTGPEDAAGLAIDNIAIMVPVDTVPGFDTAATFTEGDSPIVVATASADFADFGENDVTALTIVAAGVQDGAFETVVIAGKSFALGNSSTATATVGGTTVQIAYVASTGAFTITNDTGMMTPMAQTDLDLLIRGITYENASQNPTAGARTLTFSATDAGGLTSAPAVATINVVPVNDLPVGVRDDVMGDEDMTISGNVLANDRDLDGGALAVIEFNVPELGIFAAGATANIPGVGTLVIDATGNFTFIPVLDYNGPVPVVTYAFSDGVGRSVTAELGLNIVPVNDLPTATLNIETLTEDVTIIAAGNVITEDTGAGVDGDVDNTIRVTAVAGVVVNETGQTIVAGLYGSLTIAADGSYTYTLNSALPAVQALGSTEALTETFAYVISENIASPNLATSGSAEGAPSGMTRNWPNATVPPGWTPTTGTPDIYNGATDFLDNKWQSSPDGGDFIHAIGWDTAGEGFSSALTGLTVGETYTVSFHQSLSNSGYTDPQSVGAFNVMVDGVAFQSQGMATPPLGVAAPWILQSFTFTATGASANIEFMPTAIVGLRADLGLDGLTVRNGASGSGETATANLVVTINGTNDRPTAFVDVVLVTEDQPATGNVLANDVDPEQKPLTVTGFVVAGNATNYAAGDTATIAGVGTLTIDAAGVFTFTPTPNYFGPVPVVTYDIVDVEGATSSARLALGPVANVNDPIVISLSGGPTLPVSDDGGRAATYTENDPPVALASQLGFIEDFGERDLSALAITISGAVDGAVEQMTIAGIVVPVGIPFVGSVTINGEIVSIVSFPAFNTIVIEAPAGGTLSEATANALLQSLAYVNTSENPTAGDRTITLYTNEPGSVTTDFATARISVAPVNDAPVAMRDTAAGNEDTPITGNVLTNDRDVDGGALRVTSFEVPGVGSFAVGSTAMIPHVGALLIDALGNFTFMPAANYDGPVPVVTYLMTDGAGGTGLAELVLTLMPVNDAPVVIDPSQPGTALNPLPAADPRTIIPVVRVIDAGMAPVIDVSDYIRDPEGQALTYGVHGLPPGLSIDPLTGLISGMLTSSASQGGDPAAPGTYVVTVTVRDVLGGEVATQLTYLVANLPPVAVDDVAKVDQGRVVGIDPLANDRDPDGDGLRVVAAISEQGVVTLLDDGRLTFAPKTDFVGVATITYTIRDADGAERTAVVRVQVAPEASSAMGRPVGAAEPPAPTPFEGLSLNGAVLDVSSLGLGQSTSLDGADPAVLMAVNRIADLGGSRFANALLGADEMARLSRFVDEGWSGWRGSVGEVDGLSGFSRRFGIYDGVSEIIALESIVRRGTLMLHIQERTGGDQLIVRDVIFTTPTGERLPNWFEQVDTEVVMGRPPAGAERIAVRVAATTVDGQQHVLDVMVDVRTGQIEPYQPGQRASNVVPLFTQQLAAQPAMPDATVQRLGEMLRRTGRE